VHAGAPGLGLVLVADGRRLQHDRHRLQPRRCPQGPAQSKAVHARQQRLGDDGVGVLPHRDLQRVLAVFGDQHPEPRPAEPQPLHLEPSLVPVDDQHATLAPRRGVQALPAGRVGAGQLDEARRLEPLDEEVGEDRFVPRQVLQRVGQRRHRDDGGVLAFEEFLQLATQVQAAGVGQPQALEDQGDGLLVQERQRAAGVSNRRDAVAQGRQRTDEEVARQGVVVDDEHRRQGRLRGPGMRPAEPDAHPASPVPPGAGTRGTTLPQGAALWRPAPPRITPGRRAPPQTPESRWGG